jgi:thioredoxin reductase
MKNIIIGAGPAGLQMASFLEEHLVLEKGPSVCSFFRHFPRQRGFISINKGRDLRFDWNSFLGDTKSFRDYSEDLYPSADDYLRYAEDFVKRKKLNIMFNYEVKSIVKLLDGTFSINGGEFVVEKVFFGIGLVPRQPTINVHPSITAFTYANMPLDKEVYRDKTVVIIGTGNAALETADYIAPVTKFTTLNGRDVNAWYTHYPGHARSKNLTSIDSFFLKAASFTVFATSGERYTDSLEYQFVKEHLEMAVSDILHKVDIVIFCIGFCFDSTLVKDMVDLCPKSGFPLLTDNFESTKTPGLFFIGANSQARDYKKGTSAFIHGFRYNCQYIARSLKGIESSCMDRDQMIKKVFYQMNKSSCLLHRFDYFCDRVELLPNGQWKYTQEVPLREPPERGFTMRLGYTNPFPSKSFVQPSFIQPKEAHRCIFIHPIFQTRTQMFELPEDIYNEFSDKNWHILPFMYFLDFVEGTKTPIQVRDLIRAIPDKRGGRDLFFMNGF